MSSIVMSTQRRAAYWIAALLGVALVLWLLRSILLPFVLGAAVAYFLDPVADRLERLKMSRLAATSAITLLFIVTVLAIIVMVGPLLSDQILKLISELPDYLEDIRALLNRLVRSDVLTAISGERPTKAAASGMVTTMFGGLTKVIGNIWSGGLAVLGVLSVMLVTPVVAFYLLLDWDHMVAKIDGWLPRDHAPTIRRLIHEVDEVMAGFVRGQGTVCVVLATFYSVGLTIVGLDFGLLAGLIAGLISFIPYLGTTVGFIVSTMLAIGQFWPDYPHILVVIGVFVVGQVIEGNFLSPILVGKRVRLHPVWIMFALFAFGALFGFVGVLLAVPVAAALGVLARFAVDQYLASSLYAGNKEAVVVLRETVTRTEVIKDQTRTDTGPKIHGES